MRFCSKGAGPDSSFVKELRVDFPKVKAIDETGSAPLRLWRDSLRPDTEIPFSEKRIWQFRGTEPGADGDEHTPSVDEREEEEG